jgi:hypothetical protein
MSKKLIWQVDDSTTDRMLYDPAGVRIIAAVKFQVDREGDRWAACIREGDDFKCISWHPLCVDAKRAVEAAIGDSIFMEEARIVVNTYEVALRNIIAGGDAVEIAKAVLANPGEWSKKHE